ncbi:MAG: CHAT domain-containing protein [Oscillatoria sp. SIO1A7]|nr:CHAT domain-containing protein [Oscillatoria sp. SIO1A7]
MQASVAQTTITPASDGTGTLVDAAGNQINIQGGSLSGDGANLFHSFEKFGLSNGQIANFISNPNIRNILGRVVGGDASYINGLIQVTGANSNLFLLNPAGILFGENAQLNLAGDFAATTATGIGLDGGGLFNAIASNDYANLVGTPNAFTFAASQPGAIVNTGNLTLSGGNLSLVGGTTINTGTLSSAGGNITIAAVPGQNTLRLSQSGHLLSLDIQPIGSSNPGNFNPGANAGANAGAEINPLGLPDLLTGGQALGHATEIKVENGRVLLGGSGISLAADRNASSVVSLGSINTANAGGGGGIKITAPGDVITGNINSSGSAAGGEISFASASGKIDTSRGALNSSSDAGRGGGISLNAELDIKTGDVRADGGLQGGNIAISSRNGAIDTSGGILSSHSLYIVDSQERQVRWEIDEEDGTIDLSVEGPEGSEVNYSIASGNDLAIAVGDIANVLGIKLPAGPPSRKPTRSSPGNPRSSAQSANARRSGPSFLNSQEIQPSDYLRFDNDDTSLTVTSFRYRGGEGGNISLSASGNINAGKIEAQGWEGGGNISISSGKGGLNIAGELNSFSAAGNAGNVTLDALGDTTLSLVNAQGVKTGGNISIASRNGNVEVRRTGADSSGAYNEKLNVYVLGDEEIEVVWDNPPTILNSFSRGTAGDIEIQAQGSLKVGDILTSGETRSGNVALSARGNISTGEVDTWGGGEIRISSSEGEIDTSGGFLQSGGGEISLDAEGNIKTEDILSWRWGENYRTGGNIRVASRKGAIDTSRGEIDSDSGQLTISALGDITTADIWGGGGVEITSFQGAITNQRFQIQQPPSAGDASRGVAQPGARAGSPIAINEPTNISSGSGIKLSARGDISTGNLDTWNGADISIRSSGGTVNTTGGIIHLFSPEGSSAKLSIEAARSITTGNIASDSGRSMDANLNANLSSQNSADISITSTGGEINTAAGEIRLLSPQGSSGKLALEAAESITIGSIRANSYLNGGAISIVSQGGEINAENKIEASSNNGTASNISLNARGNITTGDVLSYGVEGGGDIAVVSQSGAIDTSSGRLAAYSNPGNAGNISLEAEGDITTANVWSYGISGGGDATLTSRSGAIDTSLGVLGSYSDKGTSGRVEINAFGDVRTGYIRTWALGQDPEARAGDIYIESRNGAIDTTAGDLSGEAEFNNFDRLSPTNAAASLFEGENANIDAYSLHGTGGNVTLTAKKGITTSHISSFGAENGGNITAFSSEGDVDTGLLFSFSARGRGGNVSLDGSKIAAGSVWSFGETQGGGIYATSRGSIDLRGATLNTYSQSGTAGEVNIRANGNVSLGGSPTQGAIRSEGQLQGGSISVSTQSGNIEVCAGCTDRSPHHQTTHNPNGSINSFSRSGNAGDVTLYAPGDITTSGIHSEGEKSGGNVTITSLEGRVNSDRGELYSFSDSGTAGNVIINAGGHVSTGTITSYGAERGGNIRIFSASENSIDTSQGDLETYSDNGIAGDVSLESPGNITTGSIRSEGLRQGGNVAIASQRNISTIGGDIDSFSERGTAGNVTLSARGNISTNNISSYGSEQSGNVTLSSSGNSITTANIFTEAQEGTSGNISITAPGFNGNIFTGNLRSVGTASGQIVNSAGNNIATGDQTSISSNGNAGGIDNTAGASVSAGDQTVSANNGDAGSINNTAGSNVTAGDQTVSANNGDAGSSSGAINNTAGSNVTAGDQTVSANNGDAGSINNTAGSNVSAGDQTISSNNGNAGSINNTAGSDISAGDQTISANNGDAGSINNTAGGNLVRGNQSVTAVGGTAGNINNIATGTQRQRVSPGSGITPRARAAGFNSQRPPIPPPGFLPQNSPQNGAIVSGAPSAAGQTEPANITANSGNLPPNMMAAARLLERNEPSPGMMPPMGEPDRDRMARGQRIMGAEGDNNSGQSNNPQSLLNSMRARMNVVGASVQNTGNFVGALELHRQNEFENYFGLGFGQEAGESASIREALVDIAKQTGNRSAVIYVTALPSELELVLFLPDGQPIRKTIPDAPREKLLEVVIKFRGLITDPRSFHTPRYLEPAQKLYKWLIAPLAEELETASIDTLLFSMDSGMRSLPVAALHDGDRFLVEKYSLSLIPSISLVDTRYQSLQNTQVLAMGASQFTSAAPLPAVPVELSAIAGRLWSGEVLLNESFTREKIVQERKHYPYQIIHLATHAEFQPGAPSNAYIQLWNDKLRLDQLREMGWHSPAVELLVLSACRTAIGDEQAELGFAGLAVAAGVKSALASLWYVSDEGTLGLMTQFYRQLAGFNEDARPTIKAEALRQAQIAMIRGNVKFTAGELRGAKTVDSIPLPPELESLNNTSLSHPYYWSGFTMIGSPW